MKSSSTSPRSIMKLALSLASFGFVATSLVVATHWATKEAIEQQRKQQLIKGFSQVLPQNMLDQNLLERCILLEQDPLLGSDQKKSVWLAKEQDKVVAMVFQTTAPDGYNGDIDLLLASDLTQKVLDVRVISHKETPGLGDRIDIRKSDWIKSFSEKSLHESNDSRWAVTKDGGMFDGFTGATITPRAVVKAVKNTLVYQGMHQSEILEQAYNCGDDSMLKDDQDD
ncbi:electron transport complex subunit RsxG [Alginatibacterium sediminis]|uniref:Ion-translocating oxidoreductase complex subunit G n=1 Tax=Alginatibacterium sediminis TaxID=2164068 RepID=A0A420EGX7_9ALTE|nr:electron transport complex subunit RsxG [Alginatibacterium sediminis]RKF19927.1 electron transport complex subunit RsxG [Alginatibacterium sediminis]